MEEYIMMNVVEEIFGEELNKGTFSGMYNKKYRKLIKRLSIKHRKNFFYVEDLHWRIMIRLLLGNALINHRVNGDSMLVRDIEKEIEKMLSLIKDNIRWHDIDVPHYKNGVPGLYLVEFEENFVNKVFRNKPKYSEEYLNSTLMGSLTKADYKLSSEELKKVEDRLIYWVADWRKANMLANIDWFRNEWVPELLGK